MPACSFGVVLWELTTGLQPEGRFLRPVVVDKECPEEVVNFMHTCLSEDPQARPSAVEIVHFLDKLR